MVYLLPLHSLFAQDPLSERNRYKVLKHELVVQEINFLNKQIDTTAIVLYDDVVFEEMQDISDNGKSYQLIKAVQYVKKRKKIAPDERPFKVVEMGKYYVVEKNLLNNNIIPYTPKTWELRAGVVSIPVKFYLPDDGDPLDFSSRSVSLGTSIGAAQQVSKSRRNLWVNYLLGAQFTMVTPTTDDFINFNTADGNSNTLSAFSLSLGIALDFEGIEVGFFLGKDFLPGSAANNWRHNGDTWFSIGVGTSLSNGKEKLTNY